MSAITTTPTTDPAASAGTNTGGSGASQVPAPVSGEKTYSQSEVEALVKERLLRQQQTLEGQANAAREKAEREAAEQKAREQGEYQKLAESEKVRAEAAEQKANQIEATARERVLRSEIRSVAVELGFANPAVAHRLVDASAVEFDDAGEPKNVKPLLEKLAKDEPYLIAGGNAGGNAAIPRTPNGTTITRDQFREQEKERALRSGKYSRL